MWTDTGLGLASWMAIAVLIAAGFHLIRRTEKQHDTDQEGNQP